MGTLLQMIHFQIIKKKILSYVFVNQDSDEEMITSKSFLRRKKEKIKQVRYVKRIIIVFQMYFFSVVNITFHFSKNSFVIKNRMENL